MANKTTHTTKKFAPLGALTGHIMYPCQAGETFYAMRGVTRDTSGRVGVFTAGEPLAGLAHPDVQLRDFSDATAGQAGFDVPVINSGMLVAAISGGAFDDINRAVFMSDNATLTFNPTKGMYLGQTKYYDARQSVFGILLDPGNESWVSWFDLAAAATIDLPDAAGALVQLVGGNHSGLVSVLSDGTFEILATSTAGVTVDGSDAGAIVVSDAGTDVRLTNNTGAALRLVVRYLGTQL